jgi:hypothetical protein
MHDRAKAARAARNRRHYRRRQEHRQCINLELGEMELELLLRLKWLAEKDAHDPVKIAAAVWSLIETSARI